MTCTEAYKEHIEYTFNALQITVLEAYIPLSNEGIRYAAINAWRDGRGSRGQILNYKSGRASAARKE